MVGDAHLRDRALGTDGGVGLPDHPHDPRREARGTHPLGELGQPLAHQEQALAQGWCQVGGEHRLAQVGEQLVDDQPRLVRDGVEVVTETRQRDW